jgi:hypothetical protein
MDSSIQSAAARLRWLVISALAVVLLLFVIAQLGLPLAGLHVEYRTHGILPVANRLLGFGTMILLAVALARLIQMLGRIASGELFTIEVVRRFRGFAFWLLAMALFGFVAPTVAALILAQPGAPHRIALVLDVRELLIVAITMLLFLLARLLERARELESEVQEFV